jgi:hypothetical protein
VLYDAEECGDIGLVVCMKCERGGVSYYEREYVYEYVYRVLWSDYSVGWYIESDFKRVECVLYVCVKSEVNE